MDVILATDCGSTTTKAILIEKKGDVYRQTYRGEAPTTVEAPVEDVTRGVLNAIEELEELSGRKILDGERIIRPSRGTEGVDIYVSTSSAGGGLQMMVMGAVKIMTAESAQRAALGAGAIVMDVIASNDMRPPHEKIERIRALRPDMILLSGGTDGGTVKHVVELAEYIRAARPKARLGRTFHLPVIYAGNREARERIGALLSEVVELTTTENIRPTLEEENLQPARLKIQELFLEHVMAHAPGYKTLMEWTDAEIMPTPAAVGLIMQKIAARHGINIIGVDIGGATTDVFSVFDGAFHRTVSANLGMSYSVSNVLAEAGVENVLRWVPFRLEEEALLDRVKNKMIRPTTIPQALDDLKVEHALAREALRLAFVQHRLLATGLKGVQKVKTLADAFLEAGEDTLIDMSRLDLLVGSGGVLSHSPRRAQAMAMMIDAFQPLGVTRLAVDSIFMMPHLGVLSQENEKAAMDVFVEDCMIELGTCVAAGGRGKPGRECMRYELKTPGGGVARGTLEFGEMALEPLGVGEEAEAEIEVTRGFDIAGSRVWRGRLRGGVAGLVFDARGRPLTLPESDGARIDALARWHSALELYPD